MPTLNDVIGRIRAYYRGQDLTLDQIAGVAGIAKRTLHGFNDDLAVAAGRRGCDRFAPTSSTIRKLESGIPRDWVRPYPPADLPDHRDASSAQSEGEAA